MLVPDHRAEYVKTLQRYLLRQVIVTLMMTIAVFTFVMLLVVGLQEMLPLLQKAGLRMTAAAFALLIPYVWPYALPMGLLTATLLVFGRFSADQELTATRASGVSLLSLTGPILLLSLVLCGVCAWMILDLTPRSRTAYNSLRFDLKSALATFQFPEQRYIDFPMPNERNLERTVYVGKKRKQDLENIFIYDTRNKTNLESKVYAPRGRFEIDKTNQMIYLRLYDASSSLYAFGAWPGQGNIIFSLDLKATTNSMRKPNLNDMTLGQLREELRNRERQMGAQEKVEPSVKSRAKQNARADLMEPIRTQIHRRVAFSFACFGFALIGIPLGIRMHRRETNIGVVVALLLVMLYYGLLVAAQSLSGKPQLVPHLLMWIPNFLFQAVGAVLLWRANRGI